MGKRKKIGEIASVSTGLVINRKQANKYEKPLKKYKMLTLKSFSMQGWLNKDELEIFDSAQIIDKRYLTQKGDIIIRLSNPHTAITIDKESIGILVPSLFVIMRVFTNDILPEYLNLLLNSDTTKRFYAVNSIGSTIQIIKASALKEIKILLPSLEHQRKTVELYLLMYKEGKLLYELMNSKEKQNKVIMEKLIKEELKWY